MQLHVQFFQVAMSIIVKENFSIVINYFTGTVGESNASYHYIHLNADVQGSVHIQKVRTISTGRLRTVFHWALVSE